MDERVGRDGRVGKELRSNTETETVAVMLSGVELSGREWIMVATKVWQ